MTIAQAETREYDAFGNVTSHTEAWEGLFGYAGKFGYQSASIPGASTPAAGLQLLGHRTYDPSTGRFLTRDPIFDGRNWYSYGGGEGNPLTQADPTGLLRGLIKKAVDALLDLLKGPKPKPSPAPTPAKPGKPQPTDYPPNNGAIP